MKNSGKTGKIDGNFLCFSICTKKADGIKDYTIKHVSVTQTTDAYGNASIGISINSRIIGYKAQAEGGYIACCPYFTTSIGFRCFNNVSTVSPLANKSVTFDIYYIDVE